MNRRGFLRSALAAAVVAPVVAEAAKSTFTPTWSDGCFPDQALVEHGLPPGWKRVGVSGYERCATYVIPARSPYEFAVGDIVTFDYEGNLKRIERLDEHPVGVLKAMDGTIHLLNGTGEIRMLIK